MGYRINYIKHLTKTKGKKHVFIVLTLGWFVLAWVKIGKTLCLTGDWMMRICGVDKYDA